MFRALALATAVASISLLGGCAIFSPFAMLSPTECMMRVMYFESNRSSAEGMLAVGTVVMNRVNDRKFPSSVCGVVGQPNQFAPGVLWKPMKEGRSKALAHQMASRSAWRRTSPGCAEREVLSHPRLQLPLHEHALRAGRRWKLVLREALDEMALEVAAHIESTAVEAAAIVEPASVRATGIGARIVALQLHLNSTGRTRLHSPHRS